MYVFYPDIYDSLVQKIIIYLMNTRFMNQVMILYFIK